MPDKFNIADYLESRKDYAAIADLEHNDDAADKVVEIDRVIYAVRSSHYKSILVLKYINGFTNREIADTFRCSLRTVARKLNRARYLAEQSYFELYS